MKHLGFHFDWLECFHLHPPSQEGSIEAGALVVFERCDPFVYNTFDFVVVALLLQVEDSPVDIGGVVCERGGRVRDRRRYRWTVHGSGRERTHLGGHDPVNGALNDPVRVTVLSMLRVGVGQELCERVVAHRIANQIVGEPAELRFRSVGAGQEALALRWCAHGFEHVEGRIDVVDV